MKLNNIVWPAIASAALSVTSILTANSHPNLSIAVGLAAIANAILATRE